MLLHQLVQAEALTANVSDWRRRQTDGLGVYCVDRRWVDRVYYSVVEIFFLKRRVRWHVLTDTGPGCRSQRA